MPWQPVSFACTQKRQPEKASGQPMLFAWGNYTGRRTWQGQGRRIHLRRRPPTPRLGGRPVLAWLLPGTPRSAPPPCGVLALPSAAGPPQLRCGTQLKLREKLASTHTLCPAAAAATATGILRMECKQWRRLRRALALSTGAGWARVWPWFCAPLGLTPGSVPLLGSPLPSGARLRGGREQSERRRREQGSAEGLQSSIAAAPAECGPLGGLPAAIARGDAHGRGLCRGVLGAPGAACAVSACVAHGRGLCGGALLGAPGAACAVSACAAHGRGLCRGGVAGGAWRRVRCLRLYNSR